MEEFLGFAVAVIVISASGVMWPGPLFAANIFYGLKSGAKAGLKISVGHTVVELPLVLLIGLGALSLVSFPQFRLIMSVVGAMALFAFAAFQLRTVFKNKSNSELQTKQTPFLAGVLLTGLNPFFIIWWLTVGFKLISDSIALWSLWGIVIMFGLHIWMDYAWLSSTSYLAMKFRRVLSNKNFKFLMIGLSAALVYFGISFLIDAFSSFKT